MIAIIDKTAEHVARNPKLEEKLLEKERNNPKFSFLLVGNPYHAYYKNKVAELRKAEGIPDPSAPETIEALAREKLELKKKMLGEIPMETTSTQAQPTIKEKKEEVPLEPPPPEQWVLEPPPLSALDLCVS